MDEGNEVCLNRSVFSGEGSYSHSVLPSLLLTAKRQGKHPLAFFESLFTSDTATAQAALYNDSS
jgi:hypothetical protein